jgi:hypothetical protein
LARTFTRADIRNKARELADQEIADALDPDADYIDDTELNRMVNASLAVWHGLVAKAVPERYEAEQTITANGATSYALPSDHYQTIGVDYQLTSNWRQSLKRVQIQERNYFDSTPSSQAEGYRLKGSALVLLPPPSSGTYIHVYVTCAPTLSSDVTTVDGVNGWEEWIVYDVAIKMAMKQGDAVDALLAERNRIQAEIEAAAAEREAVQPTRVVDTRTHRWEQGDPDFWFGR